MSARTLTDLRFRVVIVLAALAALYAVLMLVGHTGGLVGLGTLALPALFLGTAAVEDPPASGRFSSDPTKKKREELIAKSKALHEIFAEAGESMDMSKVTKITGDSKAKAEEIKRRNDELTELGKEVELLQARDDVKTMQDILGRPLPGFSFPGGNGPTPAGGSKFAGKSLGQLFVESDAYKQYSKVAKASPAVEIDFGDDEASFKAAMRTGGMKAVLTETGYAPQAIRTGLILPGALRRPVVADLIPPGTTQMNAVVYMEETTTTNNADATAEGVAKPESALVFTEKNSPVRKIATVLPITDELLEDAPAIRSYVEARLLLFLQLREETELVSGSGIAPHLTGMMNVSGINTQAKGGDPTPDAIWKAGDLIRTTSFLDPDGVIIHPLDWQDIRLLRTADGIYIFGSPNDAGPERIWGMPVVNTPAATQNTAIVGAFGTATQLFRRNTVSFAIADQHQDFFVLNQLMLRVEERLAFVVYRPKGLATVTGI